MRSGHAPLVRYLLAFGVGSIAGQALLASAFVQRTVVVPFSRWQGGLVESYVLHGPLTVSVDPSCSGLDVIALCVSASLAYPVAWRRRLAGAGIGVAMLLVLNLVRITSLASASQSTWFQALHENVWPMLLVAAAAGWILLWIRNADRATNTMTPMARRFAAWSAAMLCLYVVAVPVLTQAGLLTRAARGAAHIAAGTLNTFGADASVSQQLLRVGRAHYLVTADCITTPLIAFYFAAVFAFPLGWRIRLAGIVASVPLFTTLALVRLFTVALPVAVGGTSLAVTHGFNQILTGAVFLIAWAMWWRGDQSRMRAAASGLGVATVALLLSAAAGLALATTWSMWLSIFQLNLPPGLTPDTGTGDGQGALLILPIFQVALFAGAWSIARHHTRQLRWAVAAVALVLSQFAFLSLLGWMDAVHIRPLSAIAIRGWALIVPLVLILVASRQPVVQPLIGADQARATS